MQHYIKINPLNGRLFQLLGKFHPIDSTSSSFFQDLSEKGRKYATCREKLTKKLEKSTLREKNNFFRQTVLPSLVRASSRKAHLLSFRRANPFDLSEPTSPKGPFA